jgi:aldose sugar dehydrogenase
MRKFAKAGLMALCLGTMAGCESGSASAGLPAQSGPVVPAGDVAAEPATVTEVAAGLAEPWGIAFLPDGSALITEKAGQIRRLANGRLSPTAITGVPKVHFDGQGGLLDIAVHPDFATNGLVYFTFSEGEKRSNGTALARGKLAGDTLSDVSVIWRQDKKSGSLHYGSRILFLPDGTLLVSLGEGYSQMKKAQTLDNTFGKIVRLKDDGSIPADNPFVATAGAKGEIWSYGHRNVQGLTLDPATGQVWAHEHGPRGGDEINLITPGTNYGWPEITYGIDYSGATISPFTEKEGMAQPKVTWVPSIAPSGLAFKTSDAFPQWKGDLFAGALAGSQVRRVDLDAAGAPGQQTKIYPDEVRIRDIVEGPDGALYALTDGDGGKLLKITPAS